MFEKFTTRDANDFRQRYLGTYGFFRRGDNPKILTRINDINRVVTFSDKDGVSYTLNPDTPNDIGFEFIPPKSAWHNTSDGAYLVKRIPARQWLRGVHYKNTTIGTPNGDSAKVDFPILEQIYSKKTDPKKALSQYREASGKSSFFAVSEQIAIDWKTGSIFVLDSKVGTCKEVSGVFNVELGDVELWGTEVRDAFRRGGIEMRIVE